WPSVPCRDTARGPLPCQHGRIRLLAGPKPARRTALVKESFRHDRCLPRIRRFHRRRLDAAGRGELPAVGASEGARRRLDSTSEDHRLECRRDGRAESLPAHRARHAAGQGTRPAAPGGRVAIMSVTYISAELRRLVVARAEGLCEYCLIAEEDTFFGCE